MLRAFRTLHVAPSLPDRLKPLYEIAHNVWWSWNRDAVDLFRRLDADLFDATHHNPVETLGRVSQERLDDLVNDEGFLSHMDRVYAELQGYMEGAPSLTGPEKQNVIAYFSMEYGLTEAMPIYSGGLGVLSGDHLKAASDMGMPLVGVGMLYQEGYFRQYLNVDGWQQETYPTNDFHNMPIQLERDGNGEPLTIAVSYPGREVWAQIWRVQVGRIPLYMLDSNIEANQPDDRQLTSKLYSGDRDMRIRQEILLGVGGMRALQAVGIEPTVCHMNEGHSAFLGLERIRLAMQGHGLSFDEALVLTSAGNVFTTHTSVPAGIDLFAPHLIDRYMTDWMHTLGIDRHRFLSLGRPRHAPPEEPFSMAVLALSLSSKANGVSELHGQVAREMWQGLWPGTPANEVPIGAITNGIHHRTWISQDMANLLFRYLGPRWHSDPADTELWGRVERIPDEELWHTHERRRERLVSMARRAMVNQLVRRGASHSDIGRAWDFLDPKALTIGFARRFATYKRALLLFHDLERLSRILNQTDRPVQILFAGKAHPEDIPAKELIRSLIHAVRREDLRHRIVFLEDYDMALARYLVQGVDVWLNTPRHGQEASGTSGMKACMNGAIHLSTLDGWWHEGYSPEIGWRIGQGESYADDAYGDEVEAHVLYDLLEKDVVPLFYDRGHNSVPHGWVGLMKRSMASVGPRFNTQRMLQEYADLLYTPSVERYVRLADEGGKAARELSQWLQHVGEGWSQIRLVNVESSAEDGVTVRDEVAFTVHLALGSLSPGDVTVQVCLGITDAQGQIVDYDTIPMEPQGQTDDGLERYTVLARFNWSGLSGYTVRVLPNHPNLATTHLPGLVLWAE